VRAERRQGGVLAGKKNGVEVAFPVSFKGGGELAPREGRAWQPERGMEGGDIETRPRKRLWGPKSKTSLQRRGILTDRKGIAAKKGNKTNIVAEPDWERSRQKKKKKKNR